MTDRPQEIREHYLKLCTELGEQSLDSPYYLLAQAATEMLEVLDLLSAETKRREAAEAALEDIAAHHIVCGECDMRRSDWQQVKDEADNVDPH